MIYNAFNAERLLPNGDSSDVMLMSILSQLKSMNDNSSITYITDLSDIGTSRDSNTLAEIASRLPLRAVCSIAVGASGAYNATLPSPTMGNGGTVTYTSGQIFIIKDGSDTNKAYLLFFGGNGLRATAACNPTFSGWKFDSSAPLIAKPAPAEFNNLMSNIWVSGNYYFSTAQVSAFTDAPNGATAGYLTVVNSSGLPTSDKTLQFTENSALARRWIRTSYNSYWVSSPVVNPTAVTDASLRIGDMKISGDTLYIRTSSTVVKAL